MIWKKIRSIDVEETVLWLARVKGVREIFDGHFAVAKHAGAIIIARLFVGYIYYRRGWSDIARLSQDRERGSLILRKSSCPPSGASKRCDGWLTDYPFTFSVFFVGRNRRLRYLHIVFARSMHPAFNYLSFSLTFHYTAYCIVLFFSLSFFFPSFISLSRKTPRCKRFRRGLFLNKKKRWSRQ